MTSNNTKLQCVHIGIVSMLNASSSKDDAVYAELWICTCTSDNFHNSKENSNNQIHDEIRDEMRLNSISLYRKYKLLRNCNTIDR